MNDIVFTIVLSCLLILLLVSALVIVFFIWSRQRHQQAISLAETRLSFEQELRRTETEVSEHIMNQFARELHDNIGQQLTAMRFQIESSKLDDPGMGQKLKPIEIYLDEASQQLRLLSRTLNNDFVGHIGLWEAIQTEVERLRILNRFTVHQPVLIGQFHLTREQQLMVFRIFQEIIQNILKHAFASNVYIHLTGGENEFSLLIKDDGKGFHVQEKMEGKASGLRNIHKRASIAGLVCHIESSPGKGCTVELKNKT